MTYTTNKRTNDGRTTDLSCSWFTRLYGKQWENWRLYASEWLAGIRKGLDQRRSAIRWFLESYLVENQLPSDPSFIFQPNLELPSLFAAIQKTCGLSNASTRNNYVVEFIEWVINKDYSEPNDQGVLVPLVTNPFSLERKSRLSVESVVNPLPYKFIKDLRSIICPDVDGHFKDWKWAMSQFDRADWLKVEAHTINLDDPDCVWRERKISNKKVYEIWSPVRAMVLFIKLHLPLRTYQVRMLDSGESDTWNYQYGMFLRNNSDLSMGTEKFPWSKGVFKRIRSSDTGEWHTGLYINTNKTADQNKDTIDRGYVIPWQNEVVLRWLEKLRDWQEKYNPILEPTLWTALNVTHTGSVKSEWALKEMGSTCFLMRNASASNAAERCLPISKAAPDRLWYQLLFRLEQLIYDRGDRLNDGSRIRLVRSKVEGVPDQAGVATYFPLHSLRVSLITHYAVDGQVPLPVLSKLIAGHSRIIMTLYYVKLTPTVMRDKMLEAESMIEPKEQHQLSSFITDAGLQDITDSCVFRDQGSIEAILANRNPLGWEQRHIGLCLAGGNTVKSNEIGTMAGCWNGGEFRQNLGQKGNLFDPVPHGPENCIRCRWFITDASYLDALRAHFNSLSYRAQLSVNLAIECEQKLEMLEDERYYSEQSGEPFTKTNELQAATRRYEKQIVDADEFAKDMQACFTLIHRIIDIENTRAEDDNKQKLIAVGSLNDIHQPISLVEVNSELFQLSEICEDAEVYPDLADELRKTPGLEKRSRALNTMLIREGYQPIFMAMDEQMQLILGNALVRRMAQKTAPESWRNEGLQRVSGIIEAGHSLKKLGILDEGICAIEKLWHQTVSPLRDLVKPEKSAIGAYDHEIS